MDLVDEEDDSSVRFLDFLEHGFQPFFEFASEFCSCDERTHVERHDPLSFEIVGNVLFHDLLGDSFHDSGLSDSWIPDDDRIVLLPP